MVLVVVVVVVAVLIIDVAIADGWQAWVVAKQLPMPLKLFSCSCIAIFRRLTFTLRDLEDRLLSCLT